MVSHDGFERKIGIGFVLECYRRLLTLMCMYFPKATAKGSFEKSTTIKDCRSDRCLERLSSKTTEVIRVLKDCHQRLPK